MASTSESAIRDGPWRSPADSIRPLTVLLIEQDASAARQVCELLTEAGEANLKIEWTSQLSDALQHLLKTETDVILAGQLPASCNRTNAFEELQKASRNALVLPLNEPQQSPSGPRGPGDAYPHPAERHSLAYWLPQALHHVRRQKSTEAILHATDETLLQEKEKHRITLERISDAVLVTDANADVTHLNPVAETMTGWTCAEAQGRPLGDVFRLVNGVSREPAKDPARRAIHEETTIRLGTDCVLIRRDGSECRIEDSAAPVYDGQRQVSGAIVVFRDVSQSRAMTRKMAYLAQHDPLTGLANRTLLAERFDLAIRLAQRHHKQGALLFIDLDGFKKVNDSVGHGIGDQVLQTVAGILTRQVRTTDTVCRHGGDEFVVLLTEIEQPEDAAQVADKLLAAFTQPVMVDERSVEVAISVGISIFPDDGETFDGVIRHADAAMYHAKAQGRGCYRFAQSSPKRRKRIRNPLETRLQRAFEDNQFVLHYQPQVELRSGRILAVEALVRWVDPEWGVIYPGDFVPLAEQMGLIVPLGRWILQEACQQVNLWRADGLPAPPIAVNVSAAELGHTQFANGVSEVLRETGVAPERVELEITERVLMQSASTSAFTLGALRDIGVQVALDDFGAGFASLTQLGELPIDTIKIDRSFMLKHGTTPEGKAILNSLVELGKGLGHRVVGEGVETAQHLKFLQAHNCDVGQGFQLVHPRLPQDLSPLLMQSRLRFGGDKPD